MPSLRPGTPHRCHSGKRIDQAAGQARLADAVGIIVALSLPYRHNRVRDSLVPAGTPSNEIRLMLAALRPLMTEHVEHWLTPGVSVHGNAVKTQSTLHVARVVRMDGEIVMPFSRQAMADAKAVLWLIDHPRPIAVSDTVELADGEVLTVARTELRTMPGGTLSKVYLK